MSIDTANLGSRDGAPWANEHQVLHAEQQALRIDSHEQPQLTPAIYLQEDKHHSLRTLRSLLDPYDRLVSFVRKPDICSKTSFDCHLAEAFNEGLYYPS